MRLASPALVLPVATLAAMLAAASSIEIVRVVSAPLVLVLPGWALLAAARPRRLGTLAKAVLAIALSLAVAIVCGLALDRLGLLTPAGWTWSLGLVALGSWLLGPKSSALGIPVALRRVGMRAVILLACSAAIAGAAVATARRGALAHDEYAYTEFWMVPVRGTNDTLVTLGLHNREKVATSYRIEIVASDAVVGRWPPITLQPDETITRDLPVDPQPEPRRMVERSASGPALERPPSAQPVNRLPADQRIEAWLYRSDNPETVYRKVWALAPSARAGLAKSE